MIASDIPPAMRGHSCPNSYAKYLATYISSPLKIEKLVEVEYGRAPELHQIAEYRYQIEQQDKAAQRQYWVKDSDRFDGEDFRVAAVERAPVLFKPRKQAVKQAPLPTPTPKPKAEPRINGPLARDVVEAVAASFNITLEQLRGPSRANYLVAARSVAARLLRDKTMADGSHRFSLPQIAGIIGRNDHSTVINLLDTLEERARRVPLIVTVYNRLREAAE